MSPTAEMEPVQRTAEESAAMFDRAARRYLHMSGTEFVAAYDAGHFDADPCRPEVARVAMLLPLVGRS